MKPILSIWIKPRQTFRFLAKRDDKKNNYMVNVLFFLSSMTAGFSNSVDINKLFGGNNFVVLIITLFVSGAIGLFVWNYVFSFIIWGTGKIFQGKATIAEIKIAIAYSLVPNLVHLIIGLILIIPAIILDNIGLVIYQNLITVFIIWLFTLRILIFGLAFFNKYSYGYAFLTIFIPAAIMQGIIYGIKYVI